MAVIIHPHSHVAQEHLCPSGHLLVWLWGLPWAWVVGVFLVTPPAFSPSYSHSSWKAVSEAGGAAVGRWIWRNLPITRKRTGCRLERCTTDGIHLSHFMQEWVRFKMTNTRVSESSRMASEFSLSPSLCAPLSGTEGTGTEGDTPEWAAFMPVLLQKHPGRAEDITRCSIRRPWELNLSRTWCGFRVLRFSELLTNAGCDGVCHTRQVICSHGDRLWLPGEVTRF